MTKATHIDQTGKKLPEITLSEALFAANVSPNLMAQAVRVSLDRQHQHTHKVKGRGEVSLTTAKWFKQKGTGRARHGAQSAPIFVGGGVAHGPNGVQAGAKVLPVKVRRLSIVGALTAKAQESKITVISGLEKISDKTSDLSKILNSNGLTSKILLLTAKNYPSLMKASSNISSLKVSFYQRTGLLQVLSSHHLVVDEEALANLESWLVFTKKAQKEEPKKEEKATKTKTAKKSELTKTTKVKATKKTTK